MTSREILQSDLLDILFENRNKQYGAYALRRNYNFRMATALGISLSSMFLLLLLVNAPATSDHIFNEPDIVIVRQIPARYIPQEKKKIEPVLETRRLVQQVAQEKLTNIVIVDKNIVDILPTVNDLQNVQIGTHRSDGVATNTSIPTSLHGTGESTEGPAEKPAEKTFVPLEKTAQFPGGTQAWMKFLYMHLRVPDELEAGEKKTVMIRFQVAVDGAVTNFEVVQSAGSQYDSEVIRVLKKMPRWMPAVQNGNAVATTFTQPVTFVGLE